MILKNFTNRRKPQGFLAKTKALPIWTTNAIQSAESGNNTTRTLVATGVGTITYSIVTGQIPPGMTFNSNGNITGITPGVDSDTIYNITVRATDGAGRYTDKPFTFTISPYLRPFVAVSTSGWARSMDGINWDTGNFTLTATEYVKAIASNQSIFVVIYCGTSTYNTTNNYVTSPDGLTWTLRQLPISARWQDIKWNGSMFVLLTGTNSYYTSPDGLDWTARTFPASKAWNILATTQGKFLVANTTTETAISTDGINWTNLTNSMVISAYWGGKGNWYAGGYQDSNLFKSTTGGNFASVWNSGCFRAQWYYGIDNGNIIVSIGHNGTSCLGYSTNGTSWTLSTSPTINYASTGAWNGSRFVITSRGLNGSGGTQAQYSTDGMNWTISSMPSSQNWTIDAKPESSTPVWNTPAGNLGTFTGGTAYSKTFSATDAQTITYSLNTGTYPSGLNLTNGGVLSGTLPLVSVSTNYEFNLKVTDSLGYVATRTFTMTITP